jgi:F-type H+-transporting ATPase subunit b
MAAAEGTTVGTVEPAEHSGLPQMDVATFPSQIFWLVITFGLLFLVLSRKTLPMIAGVIGARRGRIEDDLSTAENFRKDAAGALASYEAALTQARARAHQLADENRKRIIGEIEQIKNVADAETHATIAEAEKRIASERAKAVDGVKASAAEAAAEIVQRLIGRPVSIEEAAAAVASVEAGGR